MTSYPFRPTFAPRAARPDLEMKLIRHRSAAHGAWLRSVGRELDDDEGAHRAWRCASLYCALLS